MKDWSTELLDQKGRQQAKGALQSDDPNTLIQILGWCLRHGAMMECKERVHIVDDGYLMSTCDQGPRQSLHADGVPTERERGVERGQHTDA
jgi:hypothetical protein